MILLYYRAFSWKKSDKKEEGTDARSGYHNISSFFALLPRIFSGLHFPHALTIIFYKAEKRLVPYGIAREDQMEG